MTENTKHTPGPAAPYSAERVAYLLEIDKAVATEMLAAPAMREACASVVADYEHERSTSEARGLGTVEESAIVKQCRAALEAGQPAKGGE